MFSNRYDGRQIKTIDRIFKLVPHIMSKRHDAQIFYKQQVFCEPLNTYIREHREEYPGLSYMTIIIASLVRLLALRPCLNRFAINGRLFARRHIWVSFNIKKVLRDSCVETSIKLCFDGTESLGDINRIINEQITLNRQPEQRNNVDRLADLFLALPNWLVQIAVGLFKWLDNIGCLPSSIIEASPFHTSFFFTNVKSLRLSYLYHHIYDFGTTSLFVAMGHQENTPVFDRHNSIHCKKKITLGLTIDERICDGLYLSNSLKMLKRFLDDPSQLSERLEAKVEDIP